jgi:hypothetical protein
MQVSGLIYVLRAVSIFLENDGENCSSCVKEYWQQGALFLCISEGRTDCLFAGRRGEFLCR